MYINTSVLSILLISEMKEVHYVNGLHQIARNPKMTAINSCVEIDLTGQVVSDSIGQRMYSGLLYYFCYKKYF